AITTIYNLSLHDALPISNGAARKHPPESHCRRPYWDNPRGLRILGEMVAARVGDISPHDLALVRSSRQRPCVVTDPSFAVRGHRSEEHTSELQSRFDLVC